MQAFSAADLISPAIKRTKWFLFEPFRWGTFLKLCAVSVLTEGFSGNLNFSAPGSHHESTGTPSSTTIPTINPPYFGLTPIEIALIAGIVVLCIGLGLVIFYLITRLRFALFHCLVYQTREIRPGWRLYDQQSWRFFLLSVAVGFLFLFTLLLVAFPFVLGFYRLFRSAQPGESFNFAGFFSLLLPLIPIILLFVVIAIAVHVILHDLMLPHMALENAPSGVAWREVRTRIAAEKGGFLLYTFLRVVLPLAAMVLAAIVLVIPAILTVVVFGISAAGLTVLVTNASGASKLILILLIAIVLLVLLAVAVLIALCVGGPIGIAVRNFALLFYGGRYKVLGDLLSPPPQPTPMTEIAPTPA
jgi:hypothetical protein